MKNKYGFTLLEVLISTGLMAIVISSTFQLLNYLVQLNEASKISERCFKVTQGMMDEIRGVNFEDIITNYHNSQFSIDALTNMNIPHKGVVTVNVLEPDFLLNVKIVVCWRQRTRVIGEDANFNGILDGGEDANSNGELDSPCTVEAAIAFR